MIKMNPIYQTSLRKQTIPECHGNGVYQEVKQKSLILYLEAEQEATKCSNEVIRTDKWQAQ